MAFPPFAVPFDRARPPGPRPLNGSSRVPSKSGAPGYVICPPVYPRTKHLHVSPADAMYLVIADVLKHDSESGIVLEQKRKIFIAGQSLGGFVAAYTCLKYGSPKDTDLRVAEGGFRPEITGVRSLPSFLFHVNTLAEYFAQIGPLPLPHARHLARNPSSLHGRAARARHRVVRRATSSGVGEQRKQQR